jgi:hypothetical protein
MKSINYIVVFGALAAMTSMLRVAQQSPPAANSSAPPAQETPIMDGGAGPCSLELTVTADGKPIYAANIKVHIVYGFAGIRRLDLEAYTNEQGKVKFNGLPDRVKKPPLQFRASKGELAGIATYDPQTECHASHDIPLNQKSSAQN